MQQCTLHLGIARLGVVYAVCQVVVGSVFMALGFVIPWWVALLVCAVGFGFAVLGLLSAESVVEEIDQLDVKLKRDVALMRGLQAKVGYMAAQCDDAEAAKAVQAFAEELRYSDPVSSEAIWAAEAELSAAVDSLHQAVVDGNGDAVKRLCRRASALLAERNRLCKLNK